MSFELASPTSVMQTPAPHQNEKVLTRVKPAELLQASLHESRAAAVTSGAFSNLIASDPGHHRTCQESVDEAISLLECDDILCDDEDYMANSKTELLLDNSWRFRESLESMRSGTLQIDDDDSCCSDDESEHDYDDDQVFDESEYLKQCVRERMQRRRNSNTLSLRDQSRRKELLMDNMDQLNGLVRSVFHRKSNAILSDTDTDDDYESDIESDFE